MFTHYMKSEMGTDIVEIVEMGYREQMFLSFSLFTPPVTIALSQNRLKQTLIANISWEMIKRCSFSGSNIVFHTSGQCAADSSTILPWSELNNLWMHVVLCCQAKLFASVGYQFTLISHIILLFLLPQQWKGSFIFPPVQSDVIHLCADASWVTKGSLESFLEICYNK